MKYIQNNILFIKYYSKLSLNLTAKVMNSILEHRCCPKDIKSMFCFVQNHIGIYVEVHIFRQEDT